MRASEQIAAGAEESSSAAQESLTAFKQVTVSLGRQVKNAINSQTKAQSIQALSQKEAFAVDMSPVQEIIRIPDSVRVPLAPASLEGLSNLRGKVLPIISLRKIFGLDEKVADDSSRALVIDIGQPLGFLVDKVASVINVEKNNIEEVEGISSTIDCDLLNGVIKNVNGQSLIMLLNFEQIIKREFAELSSIANATASASNTESGVTSSESEDSDELQLVSFSVAGEEYAIDIINVQEIVQDPELITRVPNSATHVLGLPCLVVLAPTVCTQLCTKGRLHLRLCLYVVYLKSWSLLSPAIFLQN